MKSVRLFDFIQFDAGSWQVVAQDGPELALKNLATNRIRRVPVADLLIDDSYLPDDPPSLPSLDDAAALETLSPGTRDGVLALHRHVHEVLHGIPPGSLPGTNPKPEYDLANPLQVRIEAKLTELAAPQNGASNGTSTPKQSPA